MNRYSYENLSGDEFESLVVRICKEVFGIGCKTFSIGKDGGKDSWFEGKAERFPSGSIPWKGTFNIQAKHTKKLDASCADNNFSVNHTSVLAKEVRRLKSVIIGAPFDNYILFTNRKLPAGAHQTIIKMFRKGIGVKNVEIIGREDMDAYLSDYPFIAEQFGLYKFEPLQFYQQDFVDVITSFSKQHKKHSSNIPQDKLHFDLLRKEGKNRLNNLSEEYFEFMMNHSNDYFDEIRRFLEHKTHYRYAKMYKNTISDLQAKIILERNRFTEFQYLMEHLVDLIVLSNRDKLKDIRSVVRIFIHFMYVNCHIGKKHAHSTSIFTS